MAEIKIEKKKPIWPWILLILIILGAIAYFVMADRQNNDYNNTDDADSEQYNDSTDLEDRGGLPYGAGASNGYENTDEMMGYEESIKDSIRIITDSTYAKKVFRNLAKATVKKAEENNIDSSNALESLKNYSEQMNDPDTQNIQVMGVSKNLKSTCDNVVQVLETIQSKSFPSLNAQVSELKQISNKINSKTSMSEQRKDVLSFFEKTKDVLNAMNP